jgi:hypothetical protein
LTPATFIEVAKLVQERLRRRAMAAQL